MKLFLLGASETTSNQYHLGSHCADCVPKHVPQGPQLKAALPKSCPKMKP